jgi:hypothetical protein
LVKNIPLPDEKQGVLKRKFGSSLSYPMGVLDGSSHHIPPLNHSKLISFQVGIEDVQGAIRFL